jgi:hypothetical protein
LLFKRGVLYLFFRDTVSEKMTQSLERSSYISAFCPQLGFGASLMTGNLANADKTWCLWKIEPFQLLYYKNLNFLRSLTKNLKLMEAIAPGQPLSQPGGNTPVRKVSKMRTINFKSKNLIKM